MKPYIGAIIQARLTSSRLPRKHLLEIAGKPLLEHMINRVRTAKLLDRVVIASPHSPECCLNEDIFIGSENDVLDRFYQATKKYGFDVVVRLTADCPLVPPSEIDRVIKRYLEGNTHYVTNVGSVGRFGVPDGWDVEAFSFDALETTWELAKDPHEREHVTSFMKTNLGFHPVCLDPPKLSVDTFEDYERLRDHFYSEALNYQLPHDTHTEMR